MDLHGKNKIKSHFTLGIPIKQGHKPGLEQGRGCTQFPFLYAQPKAPNRGGGACELTTAKFGTPLNHISEQNAEV